MICPFCDNKETKVIDSRFVDESNQIRRRRACTHKKCTERFTTYETVELALPSIIKRDGRRSHFDEKKVRYGLVKSLEKRPIQIDKIEEIVSRIKKKLRATGEREVASNKVGEWIMDELHAIDQVAYVRFASVYRDFEDIDAFRSEIDNLLKRNKA
jgi:transcriptional repressor NrdR